MLNASGVIETGSGFSAQRLGTGYYQINFTHPFTGSPAVTVSNLGGGAGSNNVWYLPFVGTGYVRLQSTNPDHAVEDARFTFIAVGPR